MKGDHRSFARAAATSLLGLFIQIVIGLALLIYSIIGMDHAAQTASAHVLICSAVWLMLAVIFDQHRRERLETLEAESLDATAARESSVFGTMSDDLRVNAKRLAWMHKFMVPAVSIAVGVSLIGMGLWHYIAMTRVLNSATDGSGTAVRGSWFAEYTGIPYQGWAISLGLGVAVVGFVFARYTSGMSKNPVWSALRAGSSAAVAASLFGLLLAMGQFAEILGAARVSRYLLVGFPVISMVLGAEVLANFLLNLYRPRKPGEMPRPAVDSWLLGSIAAPDQIAKNIGGAIGYQFGVDVSGSWAYRLVSRSLGSMILFAAGVVWLMTCFTIVGPDEKGVRVRLGREISYEDPGLKFSLPWPIERIERTPTTHLHTVDLGTPRPPESLQHILWTNDHKIKDELKVLVRSSRSGPTGESGAAVSADESLALLVVEIPLVFKIEDLKKYERLATPQTREQYLKAIARREAVRYLGTLDEAGLLSNKRVETSAKLKELVEIALDNADTGVKVVFCGVEGVHPPKDTAASYEGVVQNQLLARTLVERARLDASRTLINAAGSLDGAEKIAARVAALNTAKGTAPDAEATKALESEVEKMVRESGGQIGGKLATARADRWSKHMTQRGAAEAYMGRLAAFKANPALYYTSSYLDTLEQIMRGTRVYLVDDSDKQLHMHLDLKDLNTGGMLGYQPKEGN